MPIILQLNYQNYKIILIKLVYEFCAFFINLRYNLRYYTTRYNK